MFSRLGVEFSEWWVLQVRVVCVSMLLGGRWRVKLHVVEKLSIWEEEVVEFSGRWGWAFFEWFIGSCETSLVEGIPFQFRSQGFG